MCMTDPLADFFTRIRNSLMAGHEKVDIPNSKMKVRVAEILKEEGYIKHFRVFKDSKQGILRVYLKYSEEESVIHGLQRISRPGKRKYVGKDKIPSVLSGLGTAIISTSSGIMTDQVCRDSGVGGEVLGYVW